MNRRVFLLLITQLVIFSTKGFSFSEFFNEMINKTKMAHGHFGDVYHLSHRRLQSFEDIDNFTHYDPEVYKIIERPPRSTDKYHFNDNNIFTSDFNGSGDNSKFKNSTRFDYYFHSNSNSTNFDDIAAAADNDNDHNDSSTTDNDESYYIEPEQYSISDATGACTVKFTILASS